jgi:hypothetical protein
MKIHLERTGGFAGIPLRAVIDSTLLDSETNQNLQSLIEAADFFDLPERLPSSGTEVDRFFFKLTVEEFERSHTIEVSETGIPEKLRPLIAQVTLLARSMRNK